MIEIELGAGLSPRHAQAFEAAAGRWNEVLLGSLPPVIVNGRRIEGLVISARASRGDGPGGVLGSAGPVDLRPDGIGPASLLPATGEMEFDTDDLDALEADGRLDSVIRHEMCHVLGFGSLWPRKRLLKGGAGIDPTFVGPSAMQAFGNLTGQAATPVPVENRGGHGVARVHWREELLRTELMSSVVGAHNPLTILTLASLEDLGYEVDLGGADASATGWKADFTEHTVLGAERGKGRRRPQRTRGTRPRVLPRSSLAET